MDNLVENILTNNLVDAKDIFEEHMNIIRERKLVEMKKRIQAEAFGMMKMTRAEIEAKKKAGYRKAADVLGDPRESDKVSTATKKYRKAVVKKKVTEETIDEMRLPGEVAGTLSRKMTAGGIKLAKKYLGRDFAKTYMKGRKESAKAAAEDEAIKRAAGAPPTQTADSPKPKKKSGVSVKPQGGVKGAYGVWMQKEKPKSVGGHALSLLSKTLSAAGS